MVEVLPLERAAEGHQRMLANPTWERGQRVSCPNDIQFVARRAVRSDSRWQGVARDRLTCLRRLLLLLVVLVGTNGPRVRTNSSTATTTDKRGETKGAFHGRITA
jgi:hypothetical protein